MAKSRRRSSRAKIFLILVEVGDVGEGGGQAVFVRRPQARADSQLDLAEASRESQLLLVVDRLAVEDQHGVPVHAGVDRLDLVGRQRPGHVDAFHFRGEAQADLAGDDGHWRTSLISQIVRC